MMSPEMLEASTEDDQLFVVRKTGKLRSISGLLSGNI